MSSIIFAAAVVLTPLAAGAPLARMQSLNRWNLGARAALAWAGGTVGLALLLMLLASLGLRWWSWMVPTMAGASVVVACRMRPLHRPGGEGYDDRDPSPHRALAVVLFAIVAVAGLAQFAGATATSADLAYVWGPKAVFFALDRGLAFEQTTRPYLIHLHPNYPPLWPLLLAWGASLSRSMPWTLVPVLTWLTLIATTALVHALLRSRLPACHAAVASCLWFAVLTSSTVGSFSGGNAEALLVLFVTLAVTAVVLETAERPPDHRWIAAGALAGAVLTKSEGAVAALLLVAGVLVRDWRWRRPQPVQSAALLAAPAGAAAVLWAAVRAAHGLPLADPIREAPLEMSLTHLRLILEVCFVLLFGGVLWVAWLIPLVALLAGGLATSPMRVLPGLALTFGLPAFAVAYYLHASGDPRELIVWTFPRLIQPAVSAWLVSAAVLALDRDRRSELESPDLQETTR